jgi:hypothetical protein
MLYYKPSKAGGMAEWLKAAVLKTVEERSSGSSNLSPSARKTPSGSFHYWLIADGEWLQDNLVMGADLIGDIQIQDIQGIPKRKGIL